MTSCISNISTISEFISFFSSASLDTILQQRFEILKWLKSQKFDLIFTTQLNECENILDIVTFRTNLLKICKTYLYRSENIFLWTKDDIPV